MYKRLVRKSVILGVCLGLACMSRNTMAQVSETAYDISGSKIKLPDNIVATYQNEKVTDKDWKNLLGRTNIQKKGDPMNPTDISWKHTLIKEYVGNKLIYIESIKDKLDQTADFKKAYSDIRDQILANAAYQKEVIEKTKPTRANMEKFYQENKDKFATPENFSIRHIFVDTERNRKTDAEKAEGLKKINEAYTKLKNKEKFEDVAKEYSESDMDTRGEINGPYPLGKILQAIESTALTLQPGQYSNILTTKHGYHIIYLEEHKLGYLNPFADVSTQVFNILQNQNIGPSRDAFLKKMAETYKPTRHFELLSDSKSSLNKSLIDVAGSSIITLGQLRDIEKPLPQKPTLGQETSYLEGLAQTKSLALYAIKFGLDKDSTVVNNLSDFKENQLVAKWMEKEINERLKISDSDIHSYYDKNTGRFNTQKEINARNIYIKIVSSASTDVAAATNIAQDTANWIQDQIKKGADFAELAKKYSSLSNASTGGEIGWVHMGPMGRRFDTAAFNLKKGEVSEVVRMQDGFQIIKVEDIRDPRPMTFEEAKDSAKQMMEYDKKSQLQEEILNELFKKASFKYDVTRL